MFERFTEHARDVVVRAQAHARALEHGWIGTEHLLLALLDDADGRPARLLAPWDVRRDWALGEIERMIGRGDPALDAGALATLGIDLDEVRERVERTFGPGALSCRRPLRRRRRGGLIPFTPRAKKVLELSLREALALGDGFIGAEHVLLGMLREGEGVAAQILRSRGVDRAAVREALVRDREGAA
jgi:ATP-dependent Clp protease ATP-binding subunit ClpA